jgi:hypothetical protein
MKILGLFINSRKTQMRLLSSIPMSSWRISGKGEKIFTISFERLLERGMPTFSMILTSENRWMRVSEVRVKTKKKEIEKMFRCFNKLLPF